MCDIFSCKKTKTNSIKFQQTFSLYDKNVCKNIVDFYELIISDLLMVLLLLGLWAIQSPYVSAIVPGVSCIFKRLKWWSWSTALRMQFIRPSNAFLANWILRK